MVEEASVESFRSADVTQSGSGIIDLAFQVGRKSHHQAISALASAFREIQYDDVGY